MGRKSNDSFAVGITLPSVVTCPILSNKSSKPAHAFERLKQMLVIEHISGRIFRGCMLTID